METKMPGLISVFLLCVLVIHTDGQTCGEHGDCEPCIFNGCGWCADRVFGYQPRCMNEMEASGCSEYKLPGLSKFCVTKARKKAVVSVQEFKVNLEYGSHIKLPFEVLIPGDASKKNKLIMKYRDTGSFNETLDVFVPNSRKFRKKTTNFVMIRNIKPNTKIYPSFKLESIKCGTPEKKIKIIIRLAQKGKQEMKYVLKILMKKMKCSCECQEENEEPFSMKCYEHGTWGCGECKCHVGFYGQNCELSAEMNLGLEKQCIAPGSTIACNGRGTCIAGRCDCSVVDRRNKRYFGKFCECDDDSCPRSYNQLCGGNGVCECGQCRCNKDFTGEACDCPLAVDSCMASNGVVCNGHGDCSCGACRCEGSFKGPTCEECPECPGSCTLHRPCVECMFYSSGPLNDEQCAERCSTKYAALTDGADDEGLGCQFIDDNDCLLKFTFSQTGKASRGGQIFSVRSQKDCRLK